MRPAFPILSCTIHTHTRRHAVADPFAAKAVFTEMKSTVERSEIERSDCPYIPEKQGVLLISEKPFEFPDMRGVVLVFADQRINPARVRYPGIPLSHGKPGYSYGPDPFLWANCLLPAYSIRTRFSCSSWLSARFSLCQLLKIAKAFLTVSNSSGVAWSSSSNSS